MYSCANTGKMARMKYPGTNKARCVPEKKKKFNMSKGMKTQQLDKMPKSSVIRPVFISLRRYREIFGDSDEEEDEFYGFRAEELGLKAYRSFSVKDYLDGSERVSYRKDGARDLHSRYSVGNSAKVSTAEPPQPKRNRKETESKPAATSSSPNVYAKQYRKRDSYERRFARTAALEFDKTCLSPNVKSTTQVRANFVPRVQKPVQREGSNRHLPVNTYEVNLFPYSKKKTVPLAKQLLAKAKEGQRIRKQRKLDAVNKDSQQVRSRFGRVVKSKKLDYDDVTSPKYKGKRDDAKAGPSSLRGAHKRPLEDGEYPPNKTLRVAEVKLEKMDLPGDQTVYVNNPESPSGFQIQPLSATEAKSKFEFMDMSHQEPSKDTAPQFCSLTRKVRIKNANRIKNVMKARNRYQRPKFPGGGQRAKTIRTSNSSQVSSLNKSIGNDLNNKDIKKSERIKLKKKAKELSASKCREGDLEDQGSDASSISEVSTLGSDVSIRKSNRKTNGHMFKSKRLQELQAKMDSEIMEDASMAEETSSGEISRRNSKDQKPEESEACVNSENERNSRPRSRRQSQDQEGNQSNEDQDSEGPAAPKKKKRVSEKKNSLSRLQALKNDDAQVSSSEDEDSSKPLAQIKKDIKKEEGKEPQEPPERVVKKVIKVVKKIRTKSGETKTKVVKIIKKIGVRKKAKDTCKVVPGRRRIRCGDCKGCRITDDCGVCRWCKDKPKFGGPGTSKQSCVKRKCSNPQPPKPQGETTKRTEKASNVPVKKKKLPAKNELTLKVKQSKKGQSQLQPSAKKPATQAKPPPAGKRQALVDRPLVKVPWSDNSTEEEIWKEGFAVCFTAGVPSIVKELCFLCGSRGQEKMFYCRVCAEPFHGFCLDEEPVDESTWCCDNCSSCSVCGYQDKLLMCDRCQRGYHVECLGPYYPTEPEGEDDVWVCGRCVQCKNCGRRTAGDDPEAMWMLEFTHCQDCGRQREQNNFCPLCDKCYSDDDFDSQMVYCVKCDHWIHAECQGITVDQYECLRDLPEDVQFICRQCCEDQLTSLWYKELMEEMEAGYERIVDEIKSCNAYKQFSSHFEQLQADNGCPKDLDAIMAKVKEQKYITVESFCDEVMKVLDKVLTLVRSDPDLTKQWSSLYVTFCKELAAMFPWHKLNSNGDSEEKDENTQVSPPNGIIGPSICFEFWDHSYVSVKKTKENSDTPVEEKCPSPSTESLSSSSLPSQQELNAEEEKMEVDHDQHQEKVKVADEEPMETDNSAIEEQQQEQQSSNAEAEDTRKCLLCGVMRDADPPGPGRLLCCGLDEWVHVNCGLWSAEVFEDDEGRLQNVQVAISRGKQMKCEHCGEVGATVGCCEPRCPMNYHFMCARQANAEFQDDKKVYCAQHSFRTKKELLMRDDDFCVERRVCVDMSKIRATKKLSRGFEPHSINLVQGSLTLENIGRLNEYSDTKQTLYPIGYRTSRLYWSVKDPTKRCRYYCTVEEKKRKSLPGKSQQESKELIDQQHLHKVISHEEVNKKEKPTKNMTSFHGDLKNMAPPRSNISNDFLHAGSYGKKLKKIAPHPTPSLINHAVYPGVLFNDTNLGPSSAHLSKLRRILPATQKPLPPSPSHSPKKLLEHLNRQASHLPAIMNPVYAEKLPPVSTPSPQQKTTPSRSRKTPPAAKRTISFEESIPQTVRQLNCDHEVVAKAEDAELSNSPVKEKSAKSWLVSLRERAKNAQQSEELSVSFVITSDEGIRIEDNTCEAAWKDVFEMVQEARIDRLMKLVPFAGVNGKAMFGVHQESVVSMLEQLPGAHQLKQYSFKYNPPFDNSSLEETRVLKENPHGCARAEVFSRGKKYDMFAFLASVHRVAPQLEESTEEQENSEQTREGPLTVKRPTCLDLPMAMRYRHLKQCSFNKDAVAVYRSPIHGRGLFCTRDIAAGEMVIEYSGMLVRSVLTDKREKYYESKGIGCYMFRVDGTYVVDATMCGNAARFINHSCESNCYSRVITVDGQKKIIIFASRSISRGEELTYDYKFPIEDEKLTCLCGSKHCRKYLN